ILAIETSCDETAAAVIQEGRTVRSNVVASQIDLHRRYGGVFPEVASRQHILAIDTVIRQALVEARAGWNELEAVAVTYGPGLAGSLLVGVNAAKGLALALDVPLVGVNHLEGHLYSNWLDTSGTGGDEEGRPQISFPVVSLIVSGGHTELIFVRDHGHYQVLGRTRDDAAGEAFDKAARLLGLGYPGGPAIEETAREGNPAAFKLPRARLGGSFDFSFSGLKTALLRLVQKYDDRLALQKPGDLAQGQLPLQVSGMPVQNLAASFQKAVVDILVEKTIAAAEKLEAAEILIAGGVSANALLRQEMARRSERPVRVPPLFLCTDNAAMIGAAAHWRLARNEVSGWDLDVIPNLKLA
ncbi:MAG: tRNA (adenosine(37)-N6)-threonylcarbamoyltransferase complex transferase subunit TsaD, partial [Anaerolineae bacterium]